MSHSSSPSASPAQLAPPSPSSDSSHLDEMKARKSRSAPSNPPEPSPAPSSSLSTPEAQPNWWQDRHSIVLLICLYAAQGLPMGLAFGTVPFLLKERGSSYADLAYFSFASLPYSLKLFIAPIVDSLYFVTVGRRKSWIVPAQMTIGLTITFLSSTIHNWVQDGNVSKLTPTFILLLALAATQDIAVDGWSLTMLQRHNVSYASTCQSLGLSMGYFTTFTIFLALSNDAFSNNYLHFISHGNGAVINLSSALRLAGIYYLLLTLYVAFFKRETDDAFQHAQKKTDLPDSEAGLLNEASSKETSPSQMRPSRSATLSAIAATYSDMALVLRKPAVQRFAFVLLVAKVGFSAYDNVAPLKLLENGFSKESMASMAVMQTPFTLVGSILTGRLAAKYPPLHVYLGGYLLRLVVSLSGPPLVSQLKQVGTVSPGFYTLVLVISIVYGLAAECLMFVGVGAYFLQITASSVHVAGSYLTLLNTCTNLGGLWHRALVLWLVDQLTFRQQCSLPVDAPADAKCPVLYDGYYIISALLLPVAMCVGTFFMRQLPILSRLPDSAWRASRESSSS